jgi:hypothetical protein
MEETSSDKRANELFNHMTASFHKYYSPHILEKGEVGKVTQVMYSEFFELRMKE